MIKYSIMLTTIYFLTLSFFIQPMDPPSPAKKRSTLIWLNDEKVIFASREACFVRNPFSSTAKFKLHDELTHHIIVNKNKTKVGLCCANSFSVYDIATRKKMWSLTIPYSDNYSATFSPTDDIIMFHKGKVCINTKKPFDLLFIEPDQSFDITCNHQTNEIMYPSNNNTFSRKFLKNNQITRHPRSFIHENISYTIDSAFYTNHNDYIILNARTSLDIIESRLPEFFLLHTITKKITRLPLPPKTTECSYYYDVKIMPNSLIAAALCNKRGMHFFDIIQSKQISLDLIYRTKGYVCKNDTNVFDFSPQKAYYTAITQKKSYLNKTPACILRYDFLKQNVFPKYVVLCNYFHQKNFFIPKDIKFLLLFYIDAVHK